MAIQFQLSCEGVDGILDRLGKCFEWFGMHCRKLKYSIEYLEKSKNELKCTVKMVDDTIKDAEHNGRKPIEMARGWVQQGEDYISRANGVVEVYNKRADEPTSTIISIVFCPCETVSRRTLNCEAIMRMNQIFAHKEDGKKYATGVFEDVSYTGSSVPHALHGSSNSQNKPFIQAEIEHYRSTQLDGFAKYKAFARCESLDCVPVVIRVNAPAYYIHGSRAAVDLVMVLDASASMRLDGKLDQVKQGSIFVIHNLDAEDRLSIVSFGKKRVILPLTSMSGDGKRLANRKVRSLKPVGTSTAGPAMELAYEILDNRSYKKPVSTILLLSGGQDKQIFEESLRCKYREIFSRNRREYPTYTFGFGLDHDPRMLYYLATGGCGTYSYVTKNKSIRDAMALCIGGLTSIVAQKVKISIDPADRDVKISGMVCGGYSHHVAPGGESGFIIINDLYASEEKNFIVYVNVPAADEAAGFPRTALTKLLTVTANYYCPLSKAYVRTDPVEISVERPRRVWDQDRDISAEVASEVTRTNIFNGVKDIWLKSSQCTQYSMNVRIANEDIKSQLASLRDSIDGTEEAKAAKEKWEDLSSDLSNMIDDISEIFYMIKLSKDSGIDVSSQVTGLPYMLSWLSSHQWQRAATPGAISESKWFNFRTTRMQNMIDSVDSAPSAYIE